jgi:hypothetical protein
MLSSDLPRFSHYCRRVKRYLQRSPVVVDDEGLHAFLAIFPQWPGFPNVEVLECSGNARDFKSLPFFLGPHIRAITLEFTPSSETDAYAPLSILPRLKSQYPLLTAASITFKDPNRFLDGLTRVRCVSDAVSGWKHLRVLEVDSLDRSAWFHLQTMEALWSLTVGTLEDDVTGLLQNRSNGHCIGFRSLKLLFVRSSTVVACTRLIECLSSSPLGYLIINIKRDQRSSVSGWKALLNATASGRAHSTLLGISIYPSVTIPEPDPEATDIADLIPPLLFPDLTSLILQCPFNLNLDNDTLRDLGAWSQLRHLDLGPRLKSTDKPGVLGLVPFAQFCPRLEFLRIFVDSTINVPSTAEALKIRRKGISSRTLRRLKLDESLINATCLFAAANLLSVIFPKLEEIPAVRSVHRLHAGVL